MLPSKDVRLWTDHSCSKEVWSDNQQPTTKKQQLLNNVLISSDIALFGCHDAQDHKDSKLQVVKWSSGINQMKVWWIVCKWTSVPAIGIWHLLVDGESLPLVFVLAPVTPARPVDAHSRAWPDLLEGVCSWQMVVLERIDSSHSLFQSFANVNHMVTPSGKSTSFCSSSWALESPSRSKQQEQQWCF
jgi:hypothetical protein